MENYSFCEKTRLFANGIARVLTYCLLFFQTTDCLRAYCKQTCSTKLGFLRNYTHCFPNRWLFFRLFTDRLTGRFNFLRNCLLFSKRPDGIQVYFRDRSRAISFFGSYLSLFLYF